MFILNAVSRNYGSIPAVRDVSCEITTDGFVFIMGPSGSGKSTLLRLLSFVEAPDQGTVRLELGGLLYDTAGSTRPWPNLTCVFQRQFLWPHLTLRDNITLPLRTSGALNIEQRLARVIDLFDMSAFVNRYPNEVSGGQAQRAALARALVLDPALILIDEAYGGLDLEQQRILNDHFLRLRQSGVGLIVVTHALDLAQAQADQVIVVEDGQIAEVGTRSVFENPTSNFLRKVLLHEAGLKP